MENAAFDTLTQRLGRLERETRWWRPVGVISTALLAALVFLGAQKSPVQEEMRAKRFVIVDAKGVTHGVLGFVQDEPTLVLGAETSGGVALTTNPKEGTTLVITDNQGKRRTVLHGGPNGSALYLVDKTETARGVFVLRPDDTINLALYDKNKKARAGLSVAADGTPTVLPSGK